MIIQRTLAEAFERLLLEGDKAYTANVRRDSLMRSQSAIFLSLGLRDEELMRQGFADFHLNHTSYKEHMQNLVDGFIHNTYSEAEALSRWKGLTSRYYQRMFRAGAAAVGNPYYSNIEIGLTRRDKAFIASARRAEMKYFRNFLKDIRDPNHDPTRHPYLKRATYYADTGAKSQFYNGMVAGAGDSLEIHWVMGEPEEHCDDCPILASATYTWETLPTTPGAGDTACIFNCHCHLEFHPPRVGPKPGTAGGPIFPGSGSQAAFDAPGRWCRMETVTGRVMTGEAARKFDGLFASMNKARQMIEVTKGAERLEWIRMRRDLNARIVQEAGSNRLIPTVSVAKLQEAIRLGARTAGQAGFARDLRERMEILVVRGDSILQGIITRESQGQFFFRTASGEEFLISRNDIVYNMNPVPPSSAGAPGTAPGVGTIPNFSKMKSHAEIAEALKKVLNVKDVKDLDEMPLRYAQICAEEIVKTWKETGLDTPFQELRVTGLAEALAITKTPARFRLALDKRFEREKLDPWFFDSKDPVGEVYQRTSHLTMGKDFSTLEGIRKAIRQGEEYHQKYGHRWLVADQFKPTKGMTREDMYFRSVVHHEIGHNVFDRMSLPGLRSWERFFSSKPKDWWSKNLSGYAGARAAPRVGFGGDSFHAHEAFAEAYAVMKAVERGWIARGVVNKEILQAFEEAIGKGYEAFWRK